MSTAPAPIPNGFPAPVANGYPAAATYPAPAAGGVERQVIPEIVQVPVSQTVLVPQTTYQNRTIQIPVQSTIQVPKTVVETVPQTVTVPVMRPQKRTIKVPVTTYVDQEITENVPSYEYRTNYVSVPRTVLEPQVVTNYQTQYTQEPVTIQVPVTQTQVIAQQVNKVIEYQRFPVNSYVVAGEYQAVGQPYVSGQTVVNAAAGAVGAYAGYGAVGAYGGYTGAVGAVAAPGYIGGAYPTAAIPATYPASPVTTAPVVGYGGLGYPAVGGFTLPPTR